MSEGENLIASISSNEWLLEFTDQQKVELLEWVGYDYYEDEKCLRESFSGSPADEIEEELESYWKAQQFLLNVQFLLSLYHIGQRHLDCAPTDFARREKFKHLSCLTEGLFNELISLGPHYRAELKNAQYSVADIMDPLRAFIEVADRIARKPAKKDSRGSKKAITRKTIINELKENFERFCACEVKEENMINFIIYALECGGIPAPKRVKDLFYKPNEKIIIIRQKQ